MRHIALEGKLMQVVKGMCHYGRELAVAHLIASVICGAVVVPSIEFTQTSVDRHWNCPNCEDRHCVKEHFCFGCQMPREPSAWPCRQGRCTGTLQTWGDGMAICIAIIAIAGRMCANPGHLRMTLSSASPAQSAPLVGMRRIVNSVLIVSSVVLPLFLRTKTPSPLWQSKSASSPRAKRCFARWTCLHPPHCALSYSPCAPQALCDCELISFSVSVLQAEIC